MKLVDNWAQQIWKLWSVRLAMLAGVAAGFLTANPTALGQLVGYVPERWRPLASFGVAMIVWGVPTWARLTSQPKLNGGNDG